MWEALVIRRRGRVSLLACAFAASVLAACGGNDSGRTAGDNPANGGPPSAVTVASTADAMAAIVGVELLVTDGSSATVRYRGAGAFIGPGLVLTSARLLDADGGWDTIAITTADAVGQPMSIAYQADIVAIEPLLDVAVLRVAADPQGREVDATSLDVTALAPAPGDTPASGTAVGFATADAGSPIPTRLTFSAGLESGTGWLEADVVLTAGFAGAPVLDEQGRIVGVVALPEPGDDRTYIRRIGQALPFIEATLAGDTLLLSGRERLPPPARRAVDLPADLLISNVTLYADVRDGQPVDAVTSFASGTSRIVYAFDFEGMHPGTPWLDEWRVNGVVDPQLSPARPGWERGSSGTLVSSISDPNSLPDGVYELRILVRGIEAARVVTTVGQESDVASFERLRIAPEKGDDGQPLGQAAELAAPQSLFAFFDYQGLTPGSMWEYVWYHDGEPILESGRRIWRGGPAGNDWWVALQPPDVATFEPGTYSVTLLVEGEPLVTAAVSVVAGQN